MEKSFAIQFVSKITGINPHTIRAWEKRYQAVVPDRHQNGKRLYSQEHIDRLNKLNQLVNLGNNISDIANLPDASLEELANQYGGFASAGFRAENNNHEAKSFKEKVDINRIQQHLVLALNSYKLDIISHELEKIKTQLDPREFSLNVLAPLLAEVGAQVESGTISIAQEHSLSAILKFHVGHMLYKHYESKNKIDLNIAIATPEGELHEFGIMIAALLCSYYNINFYYLGTNMPALSLAEAANQIDAKIVLLGVSRVYSDTSGAERLENYALELLDKLNPDINVWLGGMTKTSNLLQQPNLELISTLQMLDGKLSHLVSR
jgi:MerR family transcriptional regulator, light-induced transcriptional regulator